MYTYPSTHLLAYIHTDVPKTNHLFGITCTMTFQLIYWGTYTQIHRKINVPAYLHASLSSNHKDLLVSTTTCVSAHRCTRSWPYLFIFTFILITVKIYPSTFLLFYMSTYVPVHHYICSSFFFGITCAVTFQLIYWGSYLHSYSRENKFTCLPSWFSSI